MNTTTMRLGRSITQLVPFTLHQKPVQNKEMVTTKFTIVMAV
jgi:hypothetical protein